MLVKIEAQIAGPQGRIDTGRRNIRRAPDKARIYLEQKLGHGGVAGDGDDRDVVPVHSGTPDDLAQDVVDGLDDGLVEDIETVAFFGKDDPGDHVLAVAYLAVEIAILGQDVAGDQVHHLPENGGGTYINGDGQVVVGGIAALDIDNTGLAA